MSDVVPVKKRLPLSAWIATAAGAAAVGALAVGAVSIGALAVGRLAIGRAASSAWRMMGSSRRA